MNSIRRRLTVSALLTVLTMLTGSAYALNPGPLVTLDDVLLARVAGPAVAAAVREHGGGASLMEGLSVDRKSSTSIWVNVPLGKDSARFTMKIAFGVVCSLGGGLTLYPGDVEYDADNFKAKLGGFVLKSFITETELAMEDELRDEIFGTRGLFPWCPGIEVLSDGSISLDYGPGTECTSGKETRPCPTFAKGPGKEYTCDNGRWKISGGLCTFADPDKVFVP